MQLRNQILPEWVQNNLHIVLVILLLCIMVFTQNSIHPQYFLYLTGYIYLILFFRKNFALLSSLAILLSVTSYFGENLRLIVQLNFFATLFIVTLMKYYRKKFSYRDLPLALIPFLVVLYLTMLVTSLFSKYTLTGFETIAKVTVFFLIVGLLYINLESLRTMKSYFFALFIAGVILSLGSLYELLLTGFELSNLIELAVLRTGGFLQNVNAAGGFFAIIIPMSYIHYRIENNKTTSKIFLVLLFILIIGLMITNSRAAFLSLFITFSILFYYQNRKAFKRSLVIVAAAVFAVIVIEPLNEFFTIMLRIEDGFSQREPLWDMTIAIIKDHYLFGVGPGAYGKEMFNYFPVMLDSWQGWTFMNLHEVTKGANVSHNFYLGFLSDMGIPGLFTSFFLPYLFIKLCLENLSFFKANKDLYLLNLGIFATGAGLFIRAFFDSVNILTYGYITVDLPFWILFIFIIYIKVNKTKLLDAKY
jgi:O-antigen ligase